MLHVVVARILGARGILGSALARWPALARRAGVVVELGDHAAPAARGAVDADALADGPPGSTCGEQRLVGQLAPAVASGKVLRRRLGQPDARGDVAGRDGALARRQI